MDTEPGLPRGRQQEISARLDAIRVRLQQLRERDWDAVKSQAAPVSERLEAAQRYAAEAHAAAAEVLAASVEAFGRAAEAHDRLAPVHERAATAKVGDMGHHERQAAHHRAAAAADRQGAERARLLLPGSEQAGAVPAFNEPGDAAPR